jgi:AcrR family transcriptional regulator
MARMNELARAGADDAATRRVPASRRGRATQGALLWAARKVFERDGFLDAKITDIAKTAGVATGSFYTHFADKDAIFAAILEELQDDMLHPGAHLAHATDDPIGMIEASNRAYLESYRRNAKLMRLFEQVATIDPGFQKLRRKRSQAFHKRNASAIRRLQNSGLADPALDPLATSVALSAMVSRTAYGAFVIGEPPIEFELLVQTLTQLWVNALKIPSGGQPPSPGPASPAERPGG